MTKNHFAELAAIMKANQLNMGAETYRKMCAELASFCARHNPNFNRSKFLEACGL